jgi:hypothetical protein
MGLFASVCVLGVSRGDKYKCYFESAYSQISHQVIPFNELLFPGLWHLFAGKHLVVYSADFIL